MQEMQTNNLVRKQVMLSQSNIEKLDRLAKLQNSSAAEVVRKAIDFYDPENLDMETTELMELVSERLKEAIEDTEKTRKRLDKTLNKLESKKVA